MSHRVFYFSTVQGGGHVLLDLAQARKAEEKRQRREGQELRDRQLRYSRIPGEGLPVEEKPNREGQPGDPGGHPHPNPKGSVLADRVAGFRTGAGEDDGDHERGRDHVR